MSMADMYWDGPTGPADDEPAEPVRLRARNARRAPDGDREAPGEPAPTESTPADAESPEVGALREALRRVTHDDADGWRHALHDAGFSDSETERLIFERVRPREEGRGRAAEAGAGAEE